MDNNCKRLILDRSKTNIYYIKRSSMYWRYDLTAIHFFITVDNINQILEDNKFVVIIGILNVNIDRNDYWVWKAISVADVDIVIAEYNSLFGIERDIVVQYESDFNRIKAHYSSLCFGSLYMRYMVNGNLNATLLLEVIRLVIICILICWVIYNQYV